MSCKFILRRPSSRFESSKILVVALVRIMYVLLLTEVCFMPLFTLICRYYEALRWKIICRLGVMAFSDFSEQHAVALVKYVQPVKA
jgi:hypothetical protein